MVESAHTIYLATEDGPAVAAALTALLAEQGVSVERGRAQIGWWRAGAPGWTMLETSPPELLLDRPIGSREPRLVTLARRLACEAVYLGLQGSDVLLVEVDRRGRWAATGAGDLTQRDPDRLDRDDPRAGRDGTVPRFVLLEADVAMQTAIAKTRTGAVRAIAKLWGTPGAPHPLAPDREAGGTPILLSMSRGGGGRVRHAKLGDGTIVDAPPGEPAKLEVQFDDGRRMVLLARFVERLG